MLYGGGEAVELIAIALDAVQVAQSDEKKKAQLPDSIIIVSEIHNIDPLVCLIKH